MKPCLMFTRGCGSACTLLSVLMAFKNHSREHMYIRISADCSLTCRWFRTDLIQDFEDSAPLIQTTNLAYTWSNFGLTFHVVSHVIARSCETHTESKCCHINSLKLSFNQRGSLFGMLSLTRHTVPEGRPGSCSDGRSGL